MKVTERVSKDQRLSWNRKGGVVLVVFLERATVEHTVARLGELARLPDVDLLSQLRRFTKSRVLGRRTDVDVVPAEDHFWLPADRVERARALLQQIDDADLREVVAERGLDLDRALGDFSTQQPYAVALIKGTPLFGRPMPTRPRLTDDGIRCFNDFNGDVWAWNQRNNPRVDQSVNIHAGRDVQVVTHSRNVTQAQSGENRHPDY